MRFELRNVKPGRLPAGRERLSGAQKRRLRGRAAYKPAGCPVCGTQLQARRGVLRCPLASHH